MLLAAVTESAPLPRCSGVWDDRFEMGGVEFASCCQLPESVLICRSSPSIRMKHYRRLFCITVIHTRHAYHMVSMTENTPAME